jgi:hypothetical protein
MGNVDGTGYASFSELFGCPDVEQEGAIVGDFEFGHFSRG